MRFAPKSAAPLALVLFLAACGGGAEEAAEPADTATAEAPVGDTAAAAPEFPVPGESPAPAETATATPSPSPTPTVAAATPAPAGPPTVPGAFAVCGACHSVNPGDHGIGPSLAGLFGARAGAQPGFEYSQAMKDSGLTWNQGNLDRYLDNPRGVVPGTTMAFAGVKDAARRQAIIDYMKAL